jgi:hypothetical protein
MTALAIGLPIVALAVLGMFVSGWLVRVYMMKDRISHEDTFMESLWCFLVGVYACGLTAGAIFLAYIVGAAILET